MHEKVDFSKIDCVILMLDEWNLSDGIMMYYTKLIFEPNLNIVLVGRKVAVKIFRALVGKLFNAIDLNMSINGFIKCMVSLLIRMLILKTRQKLITNNEIETIRLLSIGYRVNQIAKYKNSNVKTISQYKCCFFRKLGMTNKAINLYKLSRINMKVLHGFTKM